MRSAKVESGDVCVTLLYEDGTAVLSLEPRGPESTCVITCSLLNLYAACKGMRYQSSGPAAKLLIERKDDDIQLFLTHSHERRYRIPLAEFEQAVESLFRHSSARADLNAYAL